MIIETKCQFCKTTLHLDVDDSYAALGDPYGLMKLAACNRCANLRERRRRLHTAFEKICSALVASPRDTEVRTKATSVLEALTRRYVALICEWTGYQLAWEEVMISPFLSAPEKLNLHVKRLWSLTKQQQFGL